MSRAILVTSGKGGVGKSTITTFLGRKLASMNAKVLLIDCDLGLANLNLLLKVRAQQKYDLFDVFKGRATIQETLICVEENMDLLTLYSNLDIELFESVYLKKLLWIVSQKYDYIIYDSPAGIEKGFNLAKSMCKEAIVVVNDNEASLEDASKVVRLLKSADLFSISFLLNRFSKDGICLNEIEKLLNIKPIGVLSEIKKEEKSIFKVLGKLSFKKEIDMIVSNLLCNRSLPV